MEREYNALGKPGIWRNDRFWLAGDHVVDPRIKDNAKVKEFVDSSERARDNFKMTEYQGMNVCPYAPALPLSSLAAPILRTPLKVVVHNNAHRVLPRVRPTRYANHRLRFTYLLRRLSWLPLHRSRHVRRYHTSHHGRDLVQSSRKRQYPLHRHSASRNRWQRHYPVYSAAIEAKHCSG